MATPGSPSPRKDTLDLGNAFRFFFEDPDWVKKMAIGGLFQLLGSLLVGIFFTAGYGLRLIRRVAAGEPRPLPEWDDLGGMFVEGARAVGLYLVHLLVLGLFPAALGCVVALLGGGLSAMGGRRGDAAADAGGALLAVGIVGVYALGGLVLLALMLYLPAAFVRLALEGRFGAGFEFRENIDFIRRNPANYLLSLVLYLIGSFVAQFGILLCCVGYFPLFFWAVCLFGWGLGETVRRDTTLAPVPGP